MFEPVREVRVGPHRFGGTDGPLFVIAGPCVIESREHALRMAREIRDAVGRFGLPFVYKSSYDKANRTSIRSFRGPGVEEGMAVLAEVRESAKVPVLTDVHEIEQVAGAARCADLLQLPAFLCRQTDLLVALARSGKPVNIKKGQFLAPADMKHLVEKAEQAGSDQVTICERGVSFGYNTLVSDMTAIPIMRKACNAPVVFDATHSTQRPGGLDGKSGGNREMAPVLARAAVAAGCDGLFMEVHDDPDRALSDGPNQLRLADLEGLLRDVVAIRAALRESRSA